MTKKRISGFVHEAASCAVRVVATLLVAAAVAMAQTGGGATLVGTVKDASGAVVAGAKVKVVNTETAFVTEYYHECRRAAITFRTSSPAITRLRSTRGLQGIRARGPHAAVRRSAACRYRPGGRRRQRERHRAAPSASLLNTENVVSAYVLPERGSERSSGCHEAHRLPDAVHAGCDRRARPGRLPHRGTGTERHRRDPRRHHRQVALHRSGEPGGRRDPGQHGRHGRGQGADHRSVRRIRAFRRRFHEDGLQVGHQLTARVV